MRSELRLSRIGTHADDVANCAGKVGFGTESRSARGSVSTFRHLGVASACIEKKVDRPEGWSTTAGPRGWLTVPK